MPSDPMREAWERYHEGRVVEVPDAPIKPEEVVAVLRVEGVSAFRAGAEWMGEKVRGSCDHMAAPDKHLGERHAWRWPDVPGVGVTRNIYNPYACECEKCGISLGEFMARIRALTAREGESDEG